MAGLIHRLANASDQRLYRGSRLPPQRRLALVKAFHADQEWRFHADQECEARPRIFDLGYCCLPRPLAGMRAWVSRAFCYVPVLMLIATPLTDRFKLIWLKWGRRRRRQSGGSARLLSVCFSLLSGPNRVAIFRLRAPYGGGHG